MGKYGKTITDAYQEVLEWTVTAHKLQEKKKVTKREIDKLEDDNEHGMVALKLAQSFGTPKEVKTVQDINKRHQRAGSIEYKDQKERDAIIRKYYNMAEVYEIGTKEYADHTKNMTPGQTVDEGKMKDIVTDVKSALGKIRHRVSQKGSKFIVSVDSNDEEDAQKAMKNHPLYVAGKLRVIPEETELDEAMKYTHVVVDPDGKVAGMSTNEKDAKDIASRHKGKVVMLKKPMSQKKGDMMINRPFKEETELDEDAMVIDLDYSKNPKGLYNAVLQMSKRLGLTIYNAPQAMKDLQTKGKVRLGGKGANLVKFMKYLNDKGIEPSVDVQKGKMKEGIVEKIEYVEYKFKNSRDASSAKSYFDGIQLMKFDVNDDNISNGELMVDAGNKDMTKYHKEVMKKFKPKVMVQEMSGKDVAKRMMKIQTMKSFASKVAKMKTVSRDDLEKMLPDYIDGGDITKVLKEKKLTDAEIKKREEIAKAIEKDNPDMPMDKKMAIATATAKRVAEEEEPDKPDTAKQVDQMRDDKKKTRIAQLQLQIAKATETINKLNAQEK